MVDEIDETVKYQRGLSRFPPVWVTMIMVKVSSPSSLSFLTSGKLENTFLYFFNFFDFF
jgi:hypothetical protein